VQVKPTIISGVCKCGCSWENHHLSMIINPDSWAELQRIAPDHPPYFPDECCNYGSNETGGLKYNEKTKIWEEHCLRYVDAESPENDA